MKSAEPFSTVAPDEVPDVPNSSFLMRRSRTPTPVREKRAQEAKNRLVCAFHFQLVNCACAHAQHELSWVMGKSVARLMGCKHYSNEVRSRLTFKLLPIFN